VILVWKAPSGCPEKGALIAEVDRLLGDRGAPAGGPIQVDAAVSREGDGSFVVRLETPGEGATQVRELRGASCKAVADAAALILALMIDPAAGASEGRDGGAESEGGRSEGASARSEDATKGTEGAGAATASKESTTAGGASTKARGPGRQAADARAPPRSVAPATRPRSPGKEASRAIPIELRLGGFAAVDAGSLPAVAAGFGISGALLYGAQRFEIGAVIFPERAGVIGSLPSAGGDVELIAGTTGTCRDLVDGPLEIAPCAALEIGRLSADGFGVSTPGSGAAVWAALKGGGMLLWAPLPRLGLTARVDVAIPLLKPRFVLDGIGPVHRPSFLAGRGALGVEVLF
jgi:hypothetical protein